MRCIPRCGSRPRRRSSTPDDVRVAERGCCSCAPETARGPRSPRRCSSACRPARSDAASAGSHRNRCIPTRSASSSKRGIDISANRTKHIDEFRSQRFDTVITLCDRVREVCPQFPSRPELVHWSVPDPALEGPTDRVSYPAFERTAAELETRIGFRLPLFTDTATRGGPLMSNDEIVNVRYMVDDVDKSIAFYTEAARLRGVTNVAPAFADVKRGNLRLLLSGPKSSAGRPMPDGATPGPGAGTGSISSSTTSTPRSDGSATPARRSATTSWKVPAASRSCSRTRPATSSSSSSQPAAERRSPVTSTRIGVR